MTFSKIAASCYKFITKSFQWGELNVEAAGGDLEHSDVAAHDLDVVDVRERVDELAGVLVDLRECKNYLLIDESVWANNFGKVGHGLQAEDLSSQKRFRASHGILFPFTTCIAPRPDWPVVSTATSTRDHAGSAGSDCACTCGSGSEGGAQAELVRTQSQSNAGRT